jgi:hypothetical protein
VEIVPRNNSAVTEALSMKQPPQDSVVYSRIRPICEQVRFIHHLKFPSVTASGFPGDYLSAKPKANVFLSLDWSHAWQAAKISAEV